MYHNGLALWASVLFYESCLSIIVGLIYADLISSSTASIIGCLLLLSGFIILAVLENFIFYNSLAFTLSPWFAFLWLLGGIVAQTHEITSTASFTIWLVRALFCVTCILSSIRLSLFFWRYKNKTIPTFQSPRIYSFVIEPRSF